MNSFFLHLYTQVLEARTPKKILRVWVLESAWGNESELVEEEH